MSTFAVDVLPLTDVEPHPNADRLDLAVVGNYRVIIGKGQMVPGQLVAYIPEGAILPDALIDELGVRNYLAGAEKNRVKAQKLRGVLSQGLVYPAKPEWAEGFNAAEALGVAKFEPKIPKTWLMGADMIAAPAWWRSYDVEPYNKTPWLLVRGESVIATEKIHGTCLIVGVDDEGSRWVSSKGLSKRRVALKETEGNLYWQVAKKYDLHHRLEQWMPGHRVMLCGEIFGPGVQDLTYTDEVEFRAFDVFVDDLHAFEEEPYQTFFAEMAGLGIPTVPVLYAGPFDPALTLAVADGKECVSGYSRHLREGIVIRPEIPRADDRHGRVVLKHVSADYLLRKNGTEYE